MIRVFAAFNVDLPQTNIPPLPIREVQKTLSPEQLEIIQLKHISDLRAYIFTMKRDLTKNYSEYLKSCENNQ